MRIASTQYSVKTQSYEIYISGCSEDALCRKDCINPELQNFNYGEVLTEEKIFNIIEIIKSTSMMIKKIFILGGEPLDQKKEELIFLLKSLKGAISTKDIYLFTRFEFDNIDKDILKYVDYVKVGWYDRKLKTKSNIQVGIELATSNQKIINVKGY